MVTTVISGLSKCPQGAWTYAAQNKTIPCSARAQRGDDMKMGAALRGSEMSRKYSRARFVLSIRNPILDSRRRVDQT